MNHSGMIGSVVAMEPREFDDWLSGNASQQSPAVAGQQIYETLGCVSCHGANGEGGRGPALAGVFGKQVFLNNGQSVKADEGYIRESIVNPQAKLVAGFGPIMPTFQGQVSEEQLMQILAFIKSLQIQTPEAVRPAPVRQHRRWRPLRRQHPRSGRKIVLEREIYYEQWKHSYHQHHRESITSTLSMV